MFKKIEELDDSMYVIVDDEIRLIKQFPKGVTSGILIIYSDDCDACKNLSKKYYVNKVKNNVKLYKINIDNHLSPILLDKLDVNYVPIELEIKVSEDNFPYIDLKKLNDGLEDIVYVDNNSNIVFKNNDNESDVHGQN
jgi:hypothetical protein